MIAAITRWARREAGWDSGPAWTLLDMGPTREVPTLDLAENERMELDKRVREVLVGGYASLAELAEIAEEYLGAENRRPVSRVLIRRRWPTGCGWSASRSKLQGRARWAAKAGPTPVVSSTATPSARNPPRRATD